MSLGRLDQDENFRLGDASSRRLQDVLQKRLPRHLQGVFKTYHRVSIQHVFETYCDDDYLQKYLPGSHV